MTTGTLFGIGPVAKCDCTLLRQMCPRRSVGNRYAWPWSKRQLCPADAWHQFGIWNTWSARWSKLNSKRRSARLKIFSKAFPRIPTNAFSIRGERMSLGILSTISSEYAKKCQSRLSFAQQLIRPPADWREHKSAKSLDKSFASTFEYLHLIGVFKSARRTC